MGKQPVISSNWHTNSSSPVLNDPNKYAIGKDLAIPLTLRISMTDGSHSPSGAHMLVCPDLHSFNGGISIRQCHCLLNCCKNKLITYPATQNINNEVRYNFSLRYIIMSSIWFVYIVWTIKPAPWLRHPTVGLGALHSEPPWPSTNAFFF